MRILFISAAVLALAACGQQQTANESADTGEKTVADGGLTLGADGVPQFRPGAWEIVEAGDGGKEARRECVGGEATPQLREMVTRDYPKECKVDHESGSDRFYLKASCPQNGLTIDSELDLKGSDTQFEMKFGAFVTMPDGKRQGGGTTLSGRWVGECPAGVQPGQQIGGDSKEG